jgi:alginate O-acetyltransferase complex protein AlgJ
VNPTSVSSKSQGRVNLVLIALFFALLWLPMLDTLLHVDKTPTYNENRLLARFPQFTGLAGLKKYIAGLETYFNDHFGFRNRLIHWHNQWEYALFGNGQLSGVIVGRDDWLFFSSEEMVEHYRGVKQFTPQELRDWQTLLERRRDWLARRGIKYIFAVAPDKQSIYSEELPKWLTKIRPDTKLDQFVAYMRAHSTVDVLDLRPALRDARQMAPTYLKTDTHWNDFGGFVASQEIIKRLSKQLPGVEPLSLDSFEQQNKLRPGGDLADLLGLNQSEIIENDAVFLVPKPGLPSLESGGNLTRNNNAQGTMIVFHDSFGTALMPFLGYRFNKVEYVDSYGLDAGLINREKPVAVVNEMVERHLNMRNPNDLMTQEALK